MSEYYITPKEAVKLYKRASLDDVQMGLEIRKAYVAKDKAVDSNAFAYGACFYAGIIEGVRRERARRREGAIRRFGRP